MYAVIWGARKINLKNIKSIFYSDFCTAGLYGYLVH